MIDLQQWRDNGLFLDALYTKGLLIFFLRHVYSHSGIKLPETEEKQYVFINHRVYNWCFMWKLRTAENTSKLITSKLHSLTKLSPPMTICIYPSSVYITCFIYSSDTLFVVYHVFLKNGWVQIILHLNYFTIMIILKLCCINFWKLFMESCLYV